MFKFTIIAIILFITTAVNVIGTTISWYRVKTRFGFYFAMGMTGITFWTLISGLDYAAISIPLKVFFTKLEYVCYHLSLIYFLMFMMSYGGYGELLDKKIIRVLLWGVPASNVLIAWTNEWHQLLWSGFTRSQFGDNTVIFEHGPAFLWVAGTGYILLASIVLVSWLASRRVSEYARQQGRLLFYGSLLPLMGNLIYQFQPSEFDGVDWSSIFLSVSSLLFLWALYGTKLLDLIPIARESLVEHLTNGVFVIDISGRIADVNQAGAQILNVPAKELIGRNLNEFSIFANFDLDLVDAKKEKKMEIEIGGCYFDALFSLVMEKDTAVGYLIILHNITTRKQNELHLLQLTQTIEQSPTSIVITDINGNITYVNPYFTEATGYTANEVLGKTAGILKSGQTPEDVYQELWKTIKNGKVWKGEFYNKKKNGNLFWENTHIAPIMDNEGRIRNFVAVKVDITESKLLQNELQNLAVTDSLTGLFNRRHFFKVADKEFVKSTRHAHPMSIIMFDIDQFKYVNDTYGHLIGDQALVKVGKLIQKNERTSDIAARYGGEEFVILLPETDCNGAKLFAERLRRQVEGIIIENGDTPVRITASFGVAGITSYTTIKTLDQLISQADHALYEAKEMGKNQVICYQKLDH